MMTAVTFPDVDDHFSANWGGELYVIRAAKPNKPTNPSWFIPVIRHIGHIQRHRPEPFEGLPACELEPGTSITDIRDFQNTLHKYWHSELRRPQKPAAIRLFKLQNDKEIYVSDPDDRKEFYGVLFPRNEHGTTANAYKYKLGCHRNAIGGSTQTVGDWVKNILESATSTRTTLSGMKSEHTVRSANDVALEEVTALPEITKKELVSGLTFLLLLDQLPNGAWGESLRFKAEAFGHKEPASVTVSYWSSCALLELTGSEALEGTDEFNKYLEDHFEDGAVGYRRPLDRGGEAFYDHCRHTAIASLWWGGPGRREDLQRQCLRFLLNNRLPVCKAWGATPRDKNPEPVTTAYVLRALIDAQANNILNDPSFEEFDNVIKDFQESGISWLFQNLRQQSYWWQGNPLGAPETPAQRSQRYNFTANILAALPELYDDNAAHKKDHERVMNRLLIAWEEGGFGIPSGPSQEKPDLEATIQLVLAAGRCGPDYCDRSDQWLTRFWNDLPKLLGHGNSESAGWALTLSLIIAKSPNYLIPTSNVHRTRRKANDLRSSYREGDTERIEGILRGQPPFVAVLAHRLLSALQ